jgi:glutathione S-transferase
MRLSEQREALLNTSSATSPPVSRNEESELHFQTDEDALAARLEERRDALDALDEDTPVWLVGDRCTIADLSFLTWANVVDRIGIDLETEFPV